MDLLLRPTSVALWHDIIHEAEKTSSITLNEELEAYLVYLLMRYTDRPELLKQLIAIKFLEGVNSLAAKREQSLQEVGDHCLLFAGLFPKLAEKRLVRVSYFVNLGQAAYIGISKKTDDLYQLLAEQFVSLMDVLQSIRSYNNQYPDLLPLNAYELWNDTGSKRALSVLKQYTNAIPLSIKIKKV